LTAAGDGYLQYVDQDALVAIATHENLVIRLERRPGHYVIMGTTLALGWPEARWTPELEARLRAAFVLGSQRTDAQDIEFSIHQLVEMAVRALSPGINDPFTAMTCVDWLGSALHRMAQRRMPSIERRDEHDRLRLVVREVTFEEIVDSAFNQIRQGARTNVAVTIRLLETITTVAPVALRPEDRAALYRHAEMIVRGAREAVPEWADRNAVEERFAQACRALRVQE
jgi:uncharacterized membrane protein